MLTTLLYYYVVIQSMEMIELNYQDGKYITDIHVTVYFIIITPKKNTIIIQIVLSNQ